MDATKASCYAGVTSITITVGNIKALCFPGAVAVSGKAGESGGSAYWAKYAKQKQTKRGEAGSGADVLSGGGGKANKAGDGVNEEGPPGSSIAAS